jgi:hypothetical protein
VSRVKPVVSSLIGLGLVGALCTPAGAQDKIQLGEVLVFISAGPPDGPRRSGQLFKADRGTRKGESVLVATSASKPNSRNRREVVYELLSPKSVGVLPLVDVLGMHYVKVRPERVEAFERFIAEKVHPAVANLRPDLGILYYKSVNEPDAGTYVALFALTRESRDKYWPKGSDSDELRAAFTPAVKALTKELSTYLVEGSYAADPKLAAAVYESREWTDFVLVKE